MCVCVCAVSGRPVHGRLLQGSAKAVARPTVCRVTAVMTVEKVEERVTWTKRESIGHSVIMVMVVVVKVVTVARCTVKTGRPS